MSKVIELTQGYTAIVSDEDFNLVSKYKWRVSGRNGKVERVIAHAHSGKNNVNKTISLHRLIMGASRGQEVGHKDRNVLNNTRENLGFRTRHTRGPCKDKICSKYRGVSKAPNENKFYARIQKNGKRITLGYFYSEYDAHLAYERAAIELHGEFYMAGDTFVPWKNKRKKVHGVQG